MKIKYFLLPKMIIIISLVWMTMAIWQWWFVKLWIGNLMLGLGVGAIIFGFGYIWNWMRNMEANFQDFKDWMNNRYDTLFTEIQEARNVKIG